MNPEIKQQWVAALRSGDYKQGREFLQRDGKFCCLGVLSDLAEKDGVVVGTEDVFGRWGYPDEETDRLNIDNLCDAVIEWAGLDSCDPELNGTRCSAVNDNGTDFDTIATLIEMDPNL